VRTEGNEVSCSTQQQLAVYALESIGDEFAASRCQVHEFHKLGGSTGTDTGVRHTTVHHVQLQRVELYAPAFFSCMVISFQSTFMRSLSDIQRSACSWGGISSHRFSMLARVGLEMACAWRVCWIWQAAGAALGTIVRVAVDGMTVRVARTMEERIMVAD
jgi:hypothetical protein